MGNNFLVSDQSLSTGKYYSDVMIYKDRIMSVWSDERSGPFDVYCNIRSFTNPDTTVNIFQISTMLPERFSLNQNYPNPFNNSTKIQFDILQSDNYELNVFNNLGQKVNEIIKNYLTPGSYKVIFDSGSLSSGVYQYILSSPKERLVKSFVLIK